MPEMDAAKREALEQKWGDGLEEEDYKALERTYKSLAAEYHGVINPRLELNLIDISKWRLERDKCVKRGDTASAKRYTDMIKSTLDSEAMKVGDAKPVEAIRIDGLADKLEKMGLLEDGVLVLNKVIDYVKNDKGNYQMSRDAIDAMMLSMTNAYRFNNGLSEIPELPKEIRVQDQLGEFLAVPTFEERNTMMELGLVPGSKGGN